jgi:hypothetical protein
MTSKRSVALVSVYAVILLAIVSCSYLMEPTDEYEQNPDLVGTWYPVSTESLDQSQRYNREIDLHYKIIVKEALGEVFIAESQGVEFCGVRIDDSIMFEYRFGEETWIRANGSIVNGMLVMYETHYYNAKNWFVSVSEYSKNPSRQGTTHSGTNTAQMSWQLNNGWSHYYDGAPEKYDLQGDRLLIHMSQGRVFRAEMQQEVGGPSPGDPKVVTTRLMNGVFVSEHDGIRTAFMIDSSGKMWTLTIQDRLAVLRAIVISDSMARMVITQRVYFDTIPPAIPDAPDMTGTWISNGSESTYGDGSTDSTTEAINITYNWQGGYLFTGTIKFPSEAALPEGGYVAYDPTAYNGWLIRLGTDQTIPGKPEFKEGYGFISEDHQSMTAVGFIYDPITGTNGVVLYKFVKS